MKQVSVSKAVFPVAGLGTRFLPATKASPQEMLPVVDKPLIQHAAAEAVAAGVTELICVTGRGKRAIEDHFDQAVELEMALAQGGRQQLPAEVRGILPKGISCIFVRQAQPLGLGHAVLCARPAVGDEPFAVLLTDDLIDARTPVLAQMERLHRARGASVIAVERMSRAEISRYGVVAVPPSSHSPHAISGIVEKPAPARTPSLLGVGWPLHSDTADFRGVVPFKGGRRRRNPVDRCNCPVAATRIRAGCEFLGGRYDCGSKFGYLEANVGLAKKHPEIGAALGRYLWRRLA